MTGARFPIDRHRWFSDVLLQAQQTGTIRSAVVILPHRIATTSSHYTGAIHHRLRSILPLNAQASIVYYSHGESTLGENEAELHDFQVGVDPSSGRMNSRIVNLPLQFTPERDMNPMYAIRPGTVDESPPWPSSAQSHNQGER